MTAPATPIDGTAQAGSSDQVPVDRLEYLQGSGFLEARPSEDTVCRLMGGGDGRSGGWKKWKVKDEIEPKQHDK